MNTTLHSFKDIFEPVDGQGNVILKKIIIPIIQRDYAQGRCTPEIKRVRDRFLTSLYNAIVDRPITLDFIYGAIDERGIMTPLDGQQRLTTLFLLHWYASRKANVSREDYSFLSNFSYETRYSTRYFCEKLAHFKPSFESKLSDEIIDQTWFPLDWKKDPTISSMLVMLDSIDDRFKDVSGLWGKLMNGVVTFYFLPIKDMGLTDDLYIKMNSRGKPLTHFEHIKAELERYIRIVDDTAATRVMQKIDSEWTDMLWMYRNSNISSDEDAVIDDKFLNYFRFVCDVLCYQGNMSPQGRSSDEFDLLTQYFTGDAENVRRNIKTLESYFDCWCRIDGYSNPTDFLNSCMSYKHEDGKIIVDQRNKINIFEDCLQAYADKNGRQRRFPLNRFVLLYAVTSYLRHRKQVLESDFIRRLRTINNLIQNSEDEISDRIDRNRLPAILRQVDAIMLEGTINDDIENSFNVNQIAEEKDKKVFLEEHPEHATLVFDLEDHPILRGQISIVGLDHINYAPRFISLFLCNWDLIDCALMTIGNYSQQERNKWRYQFASWKMRIAWECLFHRSSNTGFENTQKILRKLLSKSETFSNEVLTQIKDDFIASCEKANLYPWRYYYVKYESFRPGSYGKYSNTDIQNSPYMFSVMQTKSYWSPGTYMPYLKEVDKAHLSGDSKGQQMLVYGDDRQIICENSSFALMNEKNEVIKRVPIQQNEEGIDVENRIFVLKQFIAQITAEQKEKRTEQM